MNQPFGQQNATELQWFGQHIYGAKAILEIGSCFGQSTRLMTMMAGSDVKMRAIDLGRTGESLAGLDTGAVLYRRIAGLRDCGFDAQVLLADSRSDVAKQWAWQWAPYDAVFIDGDHSYDGALRDWLSYGQPMGRLVAFHDIAAKELGISRLWSEIKADGFRTDESIHSDMGIGVVFNDALKAAA